MAELDTERLSGRHVDLPKLGNQTGDHEIDIEGWELGRSSSVVAVDVGYEGNVVSHVPLNVRRPPVVSPLTLRFLRPRIAASAPP